MTTSLPQPQTQFTSNREGSCNRAAIRFSLRPVIKFTWCMHNICIEIQVVQSRLSMWSVS